MWTMVKISSFPVQASWILPKLQVLYFYSAAKAQITSSVSLRRELQPEQPSPVSHHIAAVYIDSEGSLQNFDKNVIFSNCHSSKTHYR